MAIPSFVSASVGATDATGAFTFTGTAAGTIGDAVIVHIVIDGSGAISWGTISGTNIESLAAVANTWTEIGAFFSGGAVQERLFIGRRTSSSSAPTFSASANTSGDDVYGRMYDYTNVSAGTTLATVIENVTAGSTTTAGPTASANVADASVQSIGPDRLALNFIGVNDDNAIGAFTTSGAQGWGTSQQYADSAGTDAAVVMFQAYLGSIATGPATSSQTIGDGGTTEQRAQQFSTSGALDVSYVTLCLRKTGSPTDNLIVEIQTDSGGLPSGTPVGGSVTIPGADLTTSLRNNRYALAASLSASTTYHLVFRRDGGNDASNFYGIGTVGDVLTTAGWGLETFTGGAWANTSTADLSFALQTSADVSTGATVDGSTASNPDAADTWATVGFALIGTTVADVYVPRHPAHDFGAITPN